jgi:hypothetical protein
LTSSRNLEFLRRTGQTCVSVAQHSYLAGALQERVCEKQHLGTAVIRGQIVDRTRSSASSCWSRNLLGLLDKGRVLSLSWQRPLRDFISGRCGPISFGCLTTCTVQTGNVRLFKAQNLSTRTGRTTPQRGVRTGRGDGVETVRCRFCCLCYKRRADSHRVFNNVQTTKMLCPGLVPRLEAEMAAPKRKYTF